MERRNGRRRFLKSMVSAVAVPYLLSAGKSSATAQPAAGTKQRLEPFDYRGVRLLESRWQKQYQETRDFYYKIPEDNALKGYRERAGLSAPGKSLGGWYGDDGFIAFPQWLSGMARMSAATGDQVIGEKAHNLMLEWAKTIEPDGYFYASRKPTLHYTYEKTVCALVDLAKYGGFQDSLPPLEKITDWAIKNLARTRKPATADDFASGGSEWYTLCENLYRAFQLTGDSKYKELGDLWQYNSYWNKFLTSTDPDIHGLHAYSHVNTLSSAAMTHAITGDPQFLKAIVNAYDYFDRSQFYATGGYGPAEKLMPPDGSLGRSLEAGSNTFETVCGSWAGFKLGRYLMMFTGQAKYGDWIERLLYNSVGAALPMTPDGRTFYYSDYRLSGGHKVYNEWRWPCCSGTYAQAVADYPNLIYFKDSDGLCVNLFLPSEATWTQAGTEVKVTQETAYPESETTTLAVDVKHTTSFSIKFRVPGWAKGVTAKVNDAALSVATTPGTWATIQRTWSPGDRVTIQIPMELTPVPVDRQHPNRVAFRYGPVVLVRREESLDIPSRENVPTWITPGDKPLEFKTVDRSAGKFVPFYQTGEGEFYRMYFDLMA